MPQSKPSSGCPSTSGPSPWPSRSPPGLHVTRGRGAFWRRRLTGKRVLSHSTRGPGPRGGGGLSASLRPVSSRHLLSTRPGSGRSPGHSMGLELTKVSMTPFASGPQARRAECDHRWQRTVPGEARSSAPSSDQRIQLLGAREAPAPPWETPEASAGRDGRPEAAGTSPPFENRPWSLSLSECEQVGVGCRSCLCKSPSLCHVTSFFHGESFLLDYVHHVHAGVVPCGSAATTHCSHADVKTSDFINQSTT